MSAASEIMVIAERVIRYRTDDPASPEAEMRVRLHRPELDAATGAWRCAYEIDAPYAFRSAAHGHDAVQALVLALTKIGIDLAHPPEALRGRLIEEEPGFGFPRQDGST